MKSAIAYAIEDRSALVLLPCLSNVGMVADDRVRTCPDETAEVALPGWRRERDVLDPAMRYYDHDIVSGI